MKKSYLPKNIGHRLRFRPQASMKDGQKCDDEWTMRDVADSHVTLQNDRTKATVILGFDQIQKYTSDPGTGPTHGFLALDVHVLEKPDGRFVAEPIVRGGSTYLPGGQGARRRPKRVLVIAVSISVLLAVAVVTWWALQSPRDLPTEEAVRTDSVESGKPQATPESAEDGPVEPLGKEKADNPAPSAPPNAVRVESVPPSATPIATSSDCPSAPAPDIAPDVTLRLGDVVVAGGGEIYRLDERLNPTLVASGQHVANARGIAVDPMGRILVASRACNSGAIIGVDPKSGVQTPLVRGFGHTQGLFPTNEQDIVLVGDENPIDNVWGHFWRANLKTREKQPLYTFPRESGAAPTSIALDRQLNEFYFAAKRIYRMSPDGPRQLSLSASNVYAMTITRTGKMFMAEYDGGPVLEIELPTRTVLKTYQGFPTIRSMAVARDGKSVFVGSRSGGNAALMRVPTSGGPAETVWRPHLNEGIGVFVTVVADLQR